MINHPSQAAAKEHYRKGEPMCSACFNRCPHGTVGYVSWFCRCEVCVQRQREYARSYNDSEAGWKKHLLAAVRCRARQQRIPFDLTVEDLFLPSHCPVCGVPMARKWGSGPAASSPSLDKYDPKLGYVKGNVWIICQGCNSRKQDMTPADMKDFAARLEGAFLAITRTSRGPQGLRWGAPAHGLPIANPCWRPDLQGPGHPDSGAAIGRKKPLGL